MDDLISRAEFLKGFSYHAPEERFSPDEVIYLLKKAPTVDAVAVRHGRWTMNSDRPDTIVCNVCDSGFDVWKHEAKDFQYCPGCSARMDAKEAADE